MTVQVGLLHPGQMGSSIGAAARSAGSAVCWASEGRSAETLARAESDALDDVESLRALSAKSEIILSVCPPAEAEHVAAAVLDCGFCGVYVDANAIAPATARRIGALVEAGGASFVDGGIVGPPARREGSTFLHLSGEDAEAVAEVFAGSLIETRIAAGGAGAASAIKMAFAAYTKGTSALLLAVRGLARAEGVEDALLAQWQVTHPNLGAVSEATARGTAPKAWRFVGEMEEIAATFAAVGLPDDFHRGAARVYARMSALKDVPDADLEDVLERLLAEG